MVKPTKTRKPDNRTNSMSRRGIHPLLMGMDKIKRKPIEKKKVELSGYESAQRKRFLRAEAEESEQTKTA